jgi:HSP20 family protein
MTLLRTNYSGFPFDLLEDIFSTADTNTARRISSSTLPAVNIADNDESFVIEFAVPGLKKEDFKVNLDNNVLTVSSEREESNEEKETNYTRREFNYTAFQRSFTLPDSANGDKISAEYKDGVLKIEIPKKEEAKVKPVREISIQ